MAIEIGEALSRRDRRAFIDLPFRLYPVGSNWAPSSMRSDLRYAMDRRRNPLFRHTSASFLLARRGGEMVGRIAVFDATRFNAHHGRNWALFHHLEVVDDPEVTTALLEAAAARARSRGLERLVGPMGPLPIEPIGVMIEGFDEPPSIGVPHHHRYYAAHLERAGMEKVTDFLAGRVPTDPSIGPPQFLDAADAATAAHGYQVRNFASRRELRRWIPRLVESIRDSHADLWEYRPMDFAEASRILRRALLIVDPRLVLYLTQGDRIIGHLLMVPDVGETLARSRGRLLPLWWLRLLRAARTTPRVLLSSIGLLPEHRGTGANAVLYARMIHRADAYRFTEALLAQMNENNRRLLANLEAVGVPWTHRHRLFGRAL